MSFKQVEKPLWEIINKWEFTEHKWFKKYETLVIIILRNIQSGEIKVEKVFTGKYSERTNLKESSLLGTLK